MSVVSSTADADLADDVVHERFTEEDFDEELGAPPEVLGIYSEQTLKQ